MRLLIDLFRRRLCRPPQHTPQPTIEPLEQRSLLSANYLVSFYGLGGSGGFGEDWVDNIVDDAADATNSVVRRYDQDQGDKALRGFLHAIDKNNDKTISTHELSGVRLRVIGYSLGGVEAVNFAADLSHKNSTVQGYHLQASVPVRALVTLDPVNTSPLQHADRVTRNVVNFTNYYQQKGGDTKVDVYATVDYFFDTAEVKVYSISVDDPADIRGGPLPSSAHKSKQVRVDKGTLADQTQSHEVVSHLDGKIKGKNVNHGTIPFFVHDLAVGDLIR